MRLLILTQAVDKSDPVLGFFHEWIREFSKNFDTVHILCLKKGEYDLPQNVQVASLGKEYGASKFEYIRTFYGYIWQKRGQYDAVFVHMNPEYVVLGGLLWKLMGKKVGLWYVHRRVTWQLRLALLLSNHAFTVSEQSLQVRSSKVHVVGHGIDVPRYQVQRELHPGSVLWLGRTDPVKRFHLLMAALSLLHDDGVDFKLDVYGSPTAGREAYVSDIRGQYKNLEDAGKVQYFGSVRHEDTPRIYATHDVFINLTPSGSFDKTILEAMASECLVVVSNPLFKPVVAHDLFAETDHVENIAMAIKNALTMARDKADAERASGREFVRASHSLSGLVHKISELLAA